MPRKNANVSLSSYDDLFETVFDNSGYSAQAVIHSNAQLAYDYLKTGNVFVFRGHGGARTLYFFDRNGSDNGIIIDNNTTTLIPNAYYIVNLEDNELASQRCVLYIGCYTGKSTGPYNLVTSTYQKGAHFVLGVTDITITSKSNAFLYGFLKAIEQNQSIEAAIENGNNEVGEFTLSNVESISGLPLYTLGDSSQYLNH